MTVVCHPSGQQAHNWDMDSSGAGNSLGPGTSQPKLLQPPEHMVRSGCSVWFWGFPRQGHNLQDVLEGSKQLHVLPPSDLAHPAETWRTTARACSKLLQPLPRSGFAETTQHLLHPPLHPGMCCSALTKGLLLLSTAPFPLPAGVSCLTSPTGRPQQDLRAPTRSSGPRFLTCSVVQGEGEEQGEQQDSPCREHGGCVVTLPLSSVPPCPLPAAVALAAPSFILCLPPTRAAFPKISDLFSVARVKGVSGGFFWDASSGGWKSLRSSSAFYRTAVT